MENTIRVSRQKHEHCLFNMQETGNWFYYDTKRRVGAIRSQIYKNMNIIFYRKNYFTRNIKYCLKILRKLLLVFFFSSNLALSSSICCLNLTLHMLMIQLFHRKY